jgi:hypothetical protein
VRRLAISGGIALLLLSLSVEAFAKSNRFAPIPTPITDCETITQSGDYVLENDLVLTLNPGSANASCLVIAAPHVNVDLSGHQITCAISGGFPCGLNIELGGAAIDIEADQVSVANGQVGDQGDFSVGILAQADHLFVTNLTISTVMGLVLNDVSHSTFANIGYGVEVLGPESVGPVLSVNGGEFNIFESISSPESTFEGIVIANSNMNFIGGADVSCSAEGESGPGILLTQDSSRNFIANNNVFVLFGNGIEVDLGSTENVILGNTAVTETTAPGFYALVDQNPNCDRNFWIGNTFSNAFFPSEISASPASCIH